MPHIELDSGWVKVGIAMFTMLIAAFLSYSANVNSLHLVQQAVISNTEQIKTVKQDIKANAKRITENEKTVAVIMALLARMDKKLDRIDTAVRDLRRNKRAK